MLKGWLVIASLSWALWWIGSVHWRNSGGLYFSSADATPCVVPVRRKWFSFLGRTQPNLCRTHWPFPPPPPFCERWQSTALCLQWVMSTTMVPQKEECEGELQDDWKCPHNGHACPLCQLCHRGNSATQYTEDHDPWCLLSGFSKAWQHINPQGDVIDSMDHYHHSLQWKITRWVTIHWNATNMGRYIKYGYSIFEAFGSNTMSHHTLSDNVCFLCLSLTA